MITNHYLQFEQKKEAYNFYLSTVGIFNRKKNSVNVLSLLGD